MFRRRYVGGRSRRLAKRVRRFQRRVTGGRKGPRDQLIVTYPTAASTCDPDRGNYFFFQGWGWGDDVGTMLTNIRTESPFTLVGGGSLYQPTLKVYGYTTIDIVAAGNSRIQGELVMGTPRAASANAASTVATAFTNAWAKSYDARPTDFEFFPDTKILQNYAFWSPTVASGLKATSRILVD